jgi:Tol biopolymer transport system component
MDATDVPTFPSNTAQFTYQKLAATHCEWLLDTRIEYAGVCFPIVDIGTIGGYARVFTLGSFDNAYTIDQEPSHPTMFEMAAGVSFAKDFFKKALSVGAVASFVESQLDVNASGYTVFASADASVRPSPFACLHLYAGNIGGRLVYWDVGEPLPILAGASAEISPMALREDVSDIVDLKLNIGAKKIADMPLATGAGLEARLFKHVTLRSGYDYSLDHQPCPVGLSAGAGLTVGKFGADFGWRYKSEDLGSVWAVSLRLDLKEISKKTAEQYYAEAEQFYKAHRKFLCVYNAKKALELDPNMWKAHALIAMVNTRERREKSLEICIAYTGNEQGAFLPRGTEKGAIGGLSRVATVIRRLRSQFSTFFLVDGGNMIRSTSHPLKCALARQFYDDLGYDAAAVGDKEVSYGLAKYSPLSSTTHTELVASNLTGRQGLGNVVTSKIISKGGYKIAIVSVISPALVPVPDRDKLLAPLDEVRRSLNVHDVADANIRIIVVHDAWENIPQYASCVHKGDFILCASLDQQFAQPMTVGPATVLSAGGNATAVGFLALRFSSDKNLISFENKLVPVTEDIPADTAIDARVRIIVPATETDTADQVVATTRRVAVDGVFAFCSKRHGKVAAIYLNVPAKNEEFPLTNGKIDCGNPVVSLASSRMAYLEHNPDSACSLLRIMDLTGAEKRDIPLISCPGRAAFTPNGKWLYFSARMRDSSQGIFRIRPDGSTVTPVVSWKNAEESDIAFSDDGASMAFTSNGNGRWQLFFSNAEGFKPVCLTDGTANNTMPRFDPSGKTIAFLSDKTSLGGARELWTYSFEQAVFRQHTKDGRVGDFCWVDRSTIVFSGGDTSRLFVKSIAPPSTVRLIPGASGDYRETSPRTIGAGASARILYTREYGDGAKKIYSVKLDGSDDEAVVNSGGQDWLE